MTEYIEREALRRLMYEETFEKDSDMHHWDSGCWIRYKLFEDCIEAIPAEDVRPVVHARWNFTGKNAYSTFFRCSNCNELVDGKANFCPNCGADMREVTPDG